MLDFLSQHWEGKKAARREAAAQARAALVPPPPPPMDDIDAILAFANDPPVQLVDREESPKATHVTVSEDYRRIQALPRKVQPPEVVVRYMEGLLRRPGGSMSLLPVQAEALFEAGLRGHGFFDIPVGEGKSLISFLLPRVIPCKKALLVVRASLIAKTIRELKEVYGPHWLVAENLTVVSFQKLGRVQAEAFLEKGGFDLIIIDEAQFVKNPRAAVTKRMGRYCKAHRPKVVVMSGTILGKKLRHFAHMFGWTHHEEAPVPLVSAVIDEWSQVLDESRDQAQEEERERLVGVLADLYPPGKPAGPCSALTSARRQFFARIIDTPGVVSVQSSQGCRASIEVRRLDVSPLHNEQTRAFMRQLRNDGTATDGWQLITGPEIWACERQIALGICYVWDPRPGAEWLEARKRWGKFAREVIAWSKKLDSELAVINAIDRGELKDEEGHLETWRKWRPTFTPNSKPLWHDEAILDYCADWLKDTSEGPGIVWTEHNFFGEELARRTGLSFYGQEGKDVRGVFIERGPGGPAIVSVGSNAAGRNIQDKWARCLVTCPRPDADWWEQLIGRFHRTGQTADHVQVDVLDGCWAHSDAMRRAVASARQKVDAGKKQKLLIADMVDWDLDD